MRYLGSKERLHKDIVPIINNRRNKGQVYIEPFAGSCGIIRHCTGSRFANDANIYLIACLEAVSKGWVPPSVVTKETYQEVREHKDSFPLHYIGFIAFGCSFAGKEWGGYAQGGGRNYALESRNNLLKQAESLKGIVFSHVDYQDLNIPDNAIIYCDPPYKGVTGYSHKIDHDTFWGWAEQCAEEGSTVLVSEYNAPNNWASIFEKGNYSCNVARKVRLKHVEKIFLLKGRE